MGKIAEHGMATELPTLGPIYQHVMKSLYQIAALLSVCSIFWSCGGGSNNTPAPTVSTCSAQDPECRSIRVGGVTRTYILHLPAGFQMGMGSLVLVLHGSGQNAAGIEDLSQFRAKSDAAGFAVAFPEGLVQNQAEPEWSFYYNSFADDVGFLSQLIAKLQADLQVPIGRTYITGISAGGLMTHRVGIELSNQIAAIAVVAGAVAANPGDSAPHPALPQSPAGAVSVLILHGDQDVKVPYWGGISTAGHANFSSQEETFNYWTAAAANNCSSFDTAMPLCDAQGNISAVVEKDATSCRGSMEVRLFRLVAPLRLICALPIKHKPHLDTTPKAWLFACGTMWMPFTAPW